jgi:alpha-ketoglutarate-dependent taurine dioxygenase
LKISVEHKEQEFFAVIKDIDIKNLSDVNFLKIKNAVESFGVVVLKDQAINDEEQILFSQKFGKLERALEQDTLKGISPEITRISNVGANNEICQ